MKRIVKVALLSLTLLVGCSPPVTETGKKETQPAAAQDAAPTRVAAEPPPVLEQQAVAGAILAVMDGPITRKTTTGAQPPLGAVPPVRPDRRWPVPAWPRSPGC